MLAFLKEDSDKLAAANLHELMRCWENVHRMWQAEAHVRTVLFREETRWPGYYFRADKPQIDEEKWHVFANCRFDPKSDSWETHGPADSARLQSAAKGARTSARLRLPSRGGRPRKPPALKGPAPWLPSTLLCPHCGSRMLRWANPARHQLGRRVSVCLLQRRLPVLRARLGVDAEQLQRGGSYRYRLDPATGEHGPLPVWSPQALRSDIIFDAEEAHTHAR